MKPIKVEPTKGGERTRITMEAHPDDVERILEAFRKGELKELGIVDVQINPKWSGQEEQRRKSTDRGGLEP